MPWPDCQCKQLMTKLQLLQMHNVLWSVKHAVFALLYGVLQ